jgi:hypothetical protein
MLLESLGGGGGGAAQLTALTRLLLSLTFLEGKPFYKFMLVNVLFAYNKKHVE